MRRLCCRRARTGPFDAILEQSRVFEAHTARSNSCLVFLPMAAGREILTVEALAADGELLDVQRAMAPAAAHNAGIARQASSSACSPSTIDPIERGRATSWRWRAICAGVRDTARSAMPHDSFGPCLRTTGSALASTHPAPGPTAFAVPGFSRPTTLDECLRILHDHPEARLVAGATDLAVESNLFSRRWDQLVSLDSIDELHEFSITPEQIKIGAAVPLGEIARRWSDAPPAFRRMADAVCLTAHQKPCDAGRQSCDGLAHRRCGSTAACT